MMILIIWRTEFKGIRSLTTKNAFVKKNFYYVALKTTFLCEIILDHWYKSSDAKA